MTLLCESDSLMRAMQESMAMSDFESLARAAHTMKGSAAVFGAKDVSNAALDIEMLARDELLNEIESTWAEFEQQVQLMNDALKSLTDG